MESLLQSIVARAATPAKWLIVLGIAYTLASTAMFLAAPPETASVQTPQPRANEANTRRPAADLDSIVRADLFGVARANAAEQAAAAANENLVETRLPLVLHGVFVAENAAESTAILARKGRSETLYRIGEKVPGNASLEAVFIDHVLLRRGRSRERLAFPKTDEQLAGLGASKRTLASPGTAPPRDAQHGLNTESAPGERPGRTTPPSREPARPNAAEPSPSEVARRYKERLREDPRQTLNELGLTPMGGDDPAGYRLDRLAQSPYLRQTGLQPGDVILSINGQPVGDVGRDRLELDNVLAQGAARLEVQRGARRFFITASLNDQ